MDNFNRSYGKVLCVGLYAGFSALAARKKPLPLLLLLLAHTAEYFIKVRPKVIEKALPKPSSFINCLAFGIAWWKYL